MVSWGTVKSLLLFFGPILLPRAISYYRSVRNNKSPHAVPVRPVPSNVSKALWTIFLVAIGLLVLSFRTPENIFRATQSRLQISVDVLFNRLLALRPNGLTEADNALRLKLGSMESKLLYIKYGPNVIADCQFCNPERTDTYFYYALPSILAPHLTNLFAIAVVTSGLIIGKEGAVWRSTATIGALVIAAVDLWTVNSYDHQANSRTVRPSEVDFFFWRMHVYRTVVLSLFDMVIACLMYLSARNLAFVKPLSAPERIENAAKIIEQLRNKTNATAVLHNTVHRDDALRARKMAFWMQDVKVQNEAMEDRDVVESLQEAIAQGRLNMGNISRDAELYARNATSSMRIMSHAG